MPTESNRYKDERDLWIRNYNKLRVAAEHNDGLLDELQTLVDQWNDKLSKM